jgi:hypothetical protein
MPHHDPFETAELPLGALRKNLLARRIERLTVAPRIHGLDIEPLHALGIGCGEKVHR